MSELGLRLKEAREQKKLTLEDIQSITKIQRRYLQGIEDGNYKVLPGSFYVRAFIRQYAEAVDLNPDEILQEYKSEVPGGVVVEEQTEQLSRVSNRRSEIKYQNNKVYDILPKIVLGVLIIAVFMGVWILFQNNSNDEVKSTNLNKTDAEYEVSKDNKKNTVDKPEPKETDTEEEEKPVDNAKNNADQNKLKQVINTIETNSKRSTLELKETEKFILELLPIGTSYLDVKNGKGQIFFSGMTKEGETLTYDFSREEEVVLNIGRTLDVKMKINGEEVLFPQKPEDFVHQVITIKFDQQPM
ncbi:MAG: family transcriptional regulator [Bacillales bacterium]|nr:family transcriptional regulator [Bacillales bacterium]